MTWVPSGVMHMGASDQDIRSANDVKKPYRADGGVSSWMPPK